MSTGFELAAFCTLSNSHIPPPCLSPHALRPLTAVPLSPDTIKFKFNGDELDGDDTIQDAGLNDGDEIETFVAQTGGSR